jgi:hypothetical protein
VIRKQLEDWLRRYGAAWERRDGDAAADLFTGRGMYYWGPLDPPLTGRQAIRERWSEATSDQEQIRFRWEVLGIDGDRGFARWWSTFVRASTGMQVELDGVFVLDFAEGGLCRQLQEWWLGSEAPAPPAGDVAGSSDG